MILFAFEAYEAMAAALQKAAHLAPARFSMARFDNGELNVKIQTPVRGEDCFILCSCAPPDDRLFSVLLLAHTLKKEGAHRVTAILPYLAYARHDKNNPGESLTTAWLGAVAKASGIGIVITADLHSERARKLFAIPVASLSPAPLFAEALAQFGLKHAAIVAPDQGAIARCEDLKKAAAMPQGAVPYFEKRRTAAGILHGSLFGNVGREVVLVDDILDTGGTLISACKRLREARVDEITVMVTHALFTGERWKNLWRLGVKRIFCTDSLPRHADSKEGRIVRLSAVPLLEQELHTLVLAAPKTESAGSLSGRP